MMRVQTSLSPLLLSALLLLGCGGPQDEDLASDVPALIGAAESGDRQQLAGLLQETKNVDVRDACHWTPLMKAALYGHVEITRQLLQAGAQPDLEDKGGYTALMLAASNNHHEVVRLLLEGGADPDRIETTKGWNALIWAAKRGHIQSVEVLLASHCRRDIRDFEGNSALDWARVNNHQEIVALLEPSPR